jgi:16S rRNA processing protein RimM
VIHNPERLVCLCEITSPQGLQGEVRVKTFTQRPEDIQSYGPLQDDVGRRYEIEPVRSASNVLVARIKGVSDRDAAEKLRGVRLFIARNRLPNPKEGELYHIDLIGMRVERKNGDLIGTITAVHNYGASDLLDLALAQGGTAMLPFTTEIVPVIDLANRRLVAVPPPSLIEEAKSD